MALGLKMGSARLGLGTLILLLLSHTGDCSQSAESHFERAQHFENQGNAGSAVYELEQAIRLKPDYWSAYFRLAILQMQTGQNGVAEGNLRKVINAGKERVTLEELAHSYGNLGYLMSHTNRMEDATKMLVMAADLIPQNNGFMQNAAVALTRTGRSMEAVKYAERAWASQKTTTAGVQLMGLYRSVGRMTEAFAIAEELYALSPNEYDVLFQCAIVFSMHKHMKERAADMYRRALKMQPNNAQVMNNLANVLKDLKRDREAVELYRRSFEIYPSEERVFLNMFYGLMGMFDWTEGEENLRRLRDINRRNLQSGEEPALNSLHAMYYPLSAQEGLDIARANSASIAKKVEQTLKKPFTHRDSLNQGRLHVGYLSTYIGAFTISYLLKSIYGMYDRSIIKLSVYHLNSAQSGSKWGNKIKAEAEALVDLSGRTWWEIAEHINMERVNILIDLDGSIKDTKPQVTASLPAPVQLSYMGFCGSQGASYIHYISTDAIASPPEVSHFFQEKLVMMPRTYYVGDHRQDLYDMMGGFNPTPRSKLGIEKADVVYFSGNQFYKITPDIFEVWMRILKRVPGSVLVFIEFVADGVPMIRKAAAEHGIAESRIIFWPLAETLENVRRIASVDIFLDSPNVNAHTTAMDALWAGLPLVTVMKDKMVSRVAASILAGHGVPELIAPDLLAYEELAVTLGKDRDLLLSLKEKILVNRRLEAGGLFDTSGWLRTFERSLKLLWETYVEHPRLRKSHIIVSAK